MMYSIGKKADMVYIRVKKRTNRLHGCSRGGEMVKKDKQGNKY
jgi:hypothetical protein